MFSVYDQLTLRVAHFTSWRAYNAKGANWRTIQIQECGERLVQVPEEFAYPYYAKDMHLTADTRVFLREGVLERFQIARSILQSQGYDLRVYDGWRSIELQERLFWYYLREFTVAKFGLAQTFVYLNIDGVRTAYNALPETMRKTLFDANRTYVSWPSKDPDAPSPHATGGAVDVWLYQDGEAVNLGVPFDWMEESAGAFYHLRLNRPRFKTNDRRVCFHRERLLLAMLRAGFSCYPPEIWHFNYGNQMDAFVRGGVARYSYIEPM